MSASQRQYLAKALTELTERVSKQRSSGCGYLRPGVRLGQNQNYAIRKGKCVDHFVTRWTENRMEGNASGGRRSKIAHDSYPTHKSNLKSKISYHQEYELLLFQRFMQ
jgi:hypothetical protein